MIARIAERAIWLEKLDETTRESGWRVTPSFDCRRSVNFVLLLGRDRLHPHLEPLEGVAALGDRRARALHDGVGPSDRARDRGHLRGRHRLRRHEARSGCRP